MIDKCGYDANQWLAMLVAVARLADDLGEPDYAAELTATHKKALAQIEKLLWTGKYFRQSATTTPANNDYGSRSCSCAGDWYADILGFDDGLPARAGPIGAARLWTRCCGKDAIYGLTDCLFPDGSRIN